MDWPAETKRHETWRYQELQEKKHIQKWYALYRLEYAFALRSIWEIGVYKI